jgi:hypothetical protein
MTLTMDSDLEVAQSPAEFATTENLPVGFDVTERIISGPAANPAVTCTDIDTGTVIALGSGPAVGAGNIIAQQLNVSLLTPGHRYRLACNFDVAVGNRQTVTQTLNIPF